MVPHLVHPQVIVRIQDPTAKDDRRQMAFARGPEGNNDPLFTRGQKRLVEIFYDRRIKNCGRFNGILHGGVRADQQFFMF